MTDSVNKQIGCNLQKFPLPRAGFVIRVIPVCIFFIEGATERWKKKNSKLRQTSGGQVNQPSKCDQSDWITGLFFS